MWFKKDTLEKREDELLEKEKKIRTRALELEIQEKLVALEKTSAKQVAEFEHVFHSGMEERKSELAKLDAEILFKRDFLSEKDKTINMLKTFLEKAMECKCHGNSK